MTDVFEHNPGDHEDPLTGPSWYVGIVGVLILVAMLLGLTALYYNMVTEEEVEKVINSGREELEDLRREQSLYLTGPARWEERLVDGEVVIALIIPIEEAMELVVRDAEGTSR